MDFETGEDYIDQETGEKPDQGLLDSETGEIELIRKQPQPIIKRPFKVPSGYLKQILQDVDDKDTKVTRRIVFAEATPFSPMLFLFPSLFFFMPIMALILAVVEMVLHAWAHKKNNILRRLNINHVYYQSPMHGLVSQFCASCRYESSKETIGKMQDKCNRRFIKYGIECIKQMV